MSPASPVLTFKLQVLHGALGQRAEGVPGIIRRWVERVSLPLLQDVLQQLVQHVTCGGETQKVKGHLLSSPTAREIWGLRHPPSPIPPTSPSSPSLICSPGGWRVLLEQYWKKRAAGQRLSGNSDAHPCCFSKAAIDESGRCKPGRRSAARDHAVTEQEVHSVINSCWLCIDASPSLAARGEWR